MDSIRSQTSAARHFIVEATSLLRKRIYSDASREIPDGRCRLLAWQARTVRNYIDAHISTPVLVADLSAVTRCSAAHFSRSFKRTFGETPHAFLIRRRVELAAHCMLQTDASLSDIALQCGFTDHAHLCKHFRQSTGQPPAAWRRARRRQDLGNSVAS
jgi:AraC-like DNA-binding protein